MLCRTLVLIAASSLALSAAETTPVTTTQPAPAAAAAEAPATIGLDTLTLRQKASIVVGGNMAEAVKQYDLEPALVAQAILDAVAGKPSAVPKSEVQQVLGAYQVEMQAKAAKAGEGRKATNATYLAENGKKPGVTTTASGLQYKVLTPAKEGAVKPTTKDTVKVHYTGTLIDGTVFDSSVTRGEPATFGVTQVIKGWTEGLQLMGVGSKFQFTIPSELAYGENGPESIGPSQVLLFDVELLEIVGGK